MCGREDPGPRIAAISAAAGGRAGGRRPHARRRGCRGPQTVRGTPAVGVVPWSRVAARDHGVVQEDGSCGGAVRSCGGAVGAVRQKRTLRR